VAGSRQTFCASERRLFRRINKPAEKQDAAAAILADQEHEGMVCRERLALLLEIVTWPEEVAASKPILPGTGRSLMANPKSEWAGRVDKKTRMENPSRGPSLPSRFYQRVTSSCLFSFLLPRESPPFGCWILCIWFMQISNVVFGLAWL